jgi:hypothetical protein
LPNSASWSRDAFGTTDPIRQSFCCPRLGVSAGIGLGRERIVAGVIAFAVMAVWAALVLGGVRPFGTDNRDSSFWR